MIELLSIFKDFTPGAYGIWVIVILVAGWFTKEWRETRKLSTEDRLARRDGYAAQVASLTKENRELREELDSVRAEAREAVAAVQKSHDEYRALCHEENDQLRASLRATMDELAGIKRAILSGSIAALDTLPPPLIPEAVRAAAERSRDYLKEQK